MGLEEDNVEFSTWLLGEIQFLFRFLFSKRSFVVDFGEEHAELLFELDELAALAVLFEV